LIPKLWSLYPLPLKAKENNDLLFYKISFKAKNWIPNSIKLERDIFIQPKDYSILKFDYTCYRLISDTDKEKLYNTKIEYGYSNSPDSLLCLKNISFNNLFISQERNMELFQFRELFVQENDNSLQFKDSCYMGNMPLIHNCISRYVGDKKFWMNMPENIKNK
jgi:hypothetical protein